MPLKTLSDDIISIIEVYPSVQGESSLSGLPTTFVRLAACNLRCVWCDTTYSFGRGTPHTLTDIISQIEAAGLNHVCITGGEPLLQANVHKLMNTLCDKHLNVSIETGGSLPIDAINPLVKIIFDIKCPGSGMSHKNLWSNIEHLKIKDEVKFVIADENDYLWAKEICHKYELFSRNIPILFSPVHYILNPKELIQWILKDRLNTVRLNVQIHKYIWTPDTKGV